MRRIASKGGKACHAKGTGHEFTTEEARIQGRKGGVAVAQNKAHMSTIGKRGGATVSQDRKHMSTIGKRGGAAVSENREHMVNIGRMGGKGRMPSDADELLRDVIERLGERCNVEICVTSAGLDVRWKRSYDGVLSDERRVVDALTLTAALEAVLRWEDEADAVDAARRTR